ncbi:hypothetical protein CW753_26450 (plasmid) [Klebsiella pneumoniae]|nr:hypothetical protein CW753_26450 [Klebsiella pneumoniae]
MRDLILQLSKSSIYSTKPHHPLSCRGRGFDFVRGPAEPAPGYNLHPFESRSPQGRKRARPGADVRG